MHACGPWQCVQSVHDRKLIISLHWGKELSCQTTGKGLLRLPSSPTGQ